MVTKKILRTIFKLRRATEEEWEQVNPILDLGEPGFAYDVYGLKIGNGIDHWHDLDYINTTNQEIIDLVTQLSIADFSDGADYATKEYVDENGGKINSISVNGTPQTIDENKNVDLSIPTYTAGNGITINNYQIALEDNLIIDCGTSTIGV